MTDYGWIGVWLLIVSVAAIIIEGVLAGVWTARISKRSQVLSRRLAEEQRLLQKDAARLQAALAETAELWKPYARLLRFLRHPLVIALMQSYGRRRAAAR